MNTTKAEIRSLLFLLALATVLRSTSQVNALSGRTATISNESKPSPISTVYLGGEDKEIRIFVESETQSRCPSGFALSQLIAHCPSIVDDRNVLELSSGLGMVSAVACKYSRPNHVAVTGRDKSLLSLAYASCVQLQRSRASVSRCCMDWNIPATWPKQEYDMLLAADVLCDKQCIEPLVNVIQHYLCNDIAADDTKKQAVIVDPINQKNRQIFCYTAERAGLNVDQQEFPGSPDLMLLSISPSDR